MDEVVKAKFESVDEEFKRVNHRLSEVEDSQKVLHDLTVSVKEIAIDSKYTKEKVSSLDTRLGKIEAVPAAKWQGFTDKLFWLVVGGLIAFAIFSATGVKL